MEDRLKKNRGRQRKPYVKPEVKQVPLRPEEAMLGACKNADVGGGPVSANCNPYLCKQQGS
jgi:hypothetical protein